MRKGQAAMEFLMTYGWAILVVLAAIGALAYFGVLSPDRFLPRSCTIQGGFTCEDYKIDATANEVRFHIVNSALGQQATNVTVDIVINSGCDDGWNSTPIDLGTINSRANKQVTFACDGALSGAFSGDININYTLAGDTETHSATGAISGQPEE